MAATDPRGVGLAAVGWLSGVRRAGKTTLAQAIGDAMYLNCDLPSAQRALAEPGLPDLFYLASVADGP